MKPDLLVISVVILVLAASVLLVVRLQEYEPPPGPVVEALGGPQPEHRPSAR